MPMDERAVWIMALKLPGSLGVSATNSHIGRLNHGVIVMPRRSRPEASVAWANTTGSSPAARAASAIDMSRL